MRVRAATWVAWSLAGFSVAMLVASGVLDALPRPARSPGDWFTVGTVSDALYALLFLAFPLVGALVASRRPQNPIGWILLADGLLWMLLAVIESYSRYGVARPGSVPFPVTVGALANTLLWVPTVGLLGIYTILLFPDGKLPSRRWRPLALFSGVVIVLLSVTGMLAPGPLENQGGVRNPFGLEALPWLVGLTNIITPLLPLCILASAVSMVLRFRRSRGEVREQIKWIAFAASLVGVLFLIDIGASLLLASGTGAGTEPPWLRLLDEVGFFSYTAVPISVGFAVLKYRLYDIDVIINRALVYGPLTATLALIYFGSVVGLQAILRTLSGQESTLAVVASTLAIAALFNPLRRRVQGYVDRRFYRRKYDARKTLEAFSSTLREDTDLEALNDDLVGVVRETMQPAHTSLWLRPDTAPKGEQVE
jgi:hypothetical protein